VKEKTAEQRLFAEQFHQLVAAHEEWIEAEPPLCMSCGNPYELHRDGDEKCPTDDPNEYYVFSEG